jgi:hypothetical protein
MFFMREGPLPAQVICYPDFRYSEGVRKFGERLAENG